MGTVRIGSSFTFFLYEYEFARVIQESITGVHMSIGLSLLRSDALSYSAIWYSYLTVEPRTRHLGGLRGCPVPQGFVVI